MTNPYEPQAALANRPTSLVRRPWLACTIVSIAAIPLWSIGLFVVVNAMKPIDNPAGVPIYMMMCLLLSIFFVPINSFLIAPLLARLSMVSYAVAMIVHLLIGAAFVGLIWNWPAMVSQTPALVWTIIPYYLSILLFPPLLVGSLAYSLGSVANQVASFKDFP